MNFQDMLAEELSKIPRFSTSGWGSTLESNSRVLWVQRYNFMECLDALQRHTFFSNGKLHTSGTDVAHITHKTEGFPKSSLEILQFWLWFMMPKTRKYEPLRFQRTLVRLCSTKTHFCSSNWIFDAFEEFHEFEEVTCSFFELFIRASTAKNILTKLIKIVMVK